MRRALGLLLLALLAGCRTAERGVRRGDEGSAERAGYPDEVSKCAQPSDTGRYVGYEVGGGSASPRKADGPTRHDGTWGWDYCGFYFPSRVGLGWWHGRKYQGGLDGYQTDGPRPLHALQEKRGE